MEVIAVGYLILIATAAVVGVVVGAVGGAVVWRLGSNVVLGGVLTGCVCLLVFVADSPDDSTFLEAKLIWGIPSMTLTFLVCRVFALWLESRTSIRRTWTALAALGVSLVVGWLYLLLFRLGPGAPLRAALWADLCLILILLFLFVRHRRAARA